MKASLLGTSSNRIFAFAILAAFAFANVLAVAPALHEQIDGSSGTHQCVVTLIATGKYEQSDLPPLIIVPQPAAQFSKIATLNSVWTATPFLSASIFEHAPPALS